MCWWMLLVMTIFMKVVIGRIELVSDSTISLVTNRVSLAQCIGTVAHSFFVNDKISLVSLSIFDSPDIIKSPIAVDGLMLIEMFRESNLTVVLKKTSNMHLYEKFSSKVGNYIIQIRRSIEIRDILLKLRSYPTWNSQAKFLVMSAEVFEDPYSVANHVINELKLFKVVSGVALISEKNDGNTYMAYSWMPFKDGTCEKGLANITIIDQCHFGNLNRNINWFSNKEAHDLNGCIFKVRAVVWPPYIVSSDISNKVHKIGIEANIIQTMSETANFSIEISSSNKEQDWGTFDNGNATGALLLLMQERFDIAIGSFAGTSDIHEHLDYVTYNVPESLTWCVPHATDANNWKRLLMVIPGVVWLGIVIIYLVISYCLWRLSHYNMEESASYRNISSSMQNSFAVLASIAVKFQPKTVNTRLLFLVWAYFSLHIAALYQSALISALTKPKYEQKITTINDIFESKLNMWLLANNQRYFRDDSDFIDRNILRKSQECTDIEKCLNDTAFGRTSATCTPRLHMKYVESQYLSPEGQPFLYCFKESIVTYPLEMYLTKDFPLSTYFQLLVSRITGAGLIAHWEKQIFEYKQRNMDITSNNIYQLSLSQLESVFIILAIGIFIAIIAFIVELYTFKYYHHRFQ